MPVLHLTGISLFLNLLNRHSIGEKIHRIQTVNFVDAELWSQVGRAFFRSAASVFVGVPFTVMVQIFESITVGGKQFLVRKWQIIKWLCLPVVWQYGLSLFPFQSIFCCLQPKLSEIICPVDKGHNTGWSVFLHNLTYLVTNKLNEVWWIAHRDGIFRFSASNGLLEWLHSYSYIIGYKIHEKSISRLAWKCQTQ